MLVEDVIPAVAIEDDRSPVGIDSFRDDAQVLAASYAGSGTCSWVACTRRGYSEPGLAQPNMKLIEAGEVPLPEGLTPHKLRHTFASILVALGVDPGSVMDQLGHTDRGFTLRVYCHGMRRDGPA